MTHNPHLSLIESYSNEFRAQIGRINSFVKHPTAIGSSHEGILRRFLQKYVPRKYSVSEGFIVDGNNNSSQQCDIIIWSSLEYSPYYSEGDFVIIPSDAARVVIEVKTQLDQKTLKQSFQNLHSVRLVGDHIYTALFSFESIDLKSILRSLIKTSTIPIEQASAINSIYAMGTWLLQLCRDIPLDKRGVWMETRQQHLSKIKDPLALTIIIPPKEQAVAHNLTDFLSFMFMNLDGPSTFNHTDGSSTNYHIFVGRGIQVYSNTLQSDEQVDKTNPFDGVLKDEFLEKSIKEINMHSKSRR
jgi:hypothetical protein